MRQEKNHMYITFPAVPENERISRMVIAAFVVGMNPTVEELEDVKTAVSEAVTNCIIHAYEENERADHNVWMNCKREMNQICVEIIDKGRGIADIPLAMEPMYTTKAKEDRSGMGFAFMEAFMDRLEVESEPGKGTKVTMWKTIGK